MRYEGCEGVELLAGVLRVFVAKVFDDLIDVFVWVEEMRGGEEIEAFDELRAFG